MDIKVYPADKSHKFIGVTVDANGPYPLVNALRAVASKIKQTKNIFVAQGLYERSFMSADDNRLDLEFEFYIMESDEIETTEQARGLLVKEGIGNSTLLVESRGGAGSVLMIKLQLSRGVDQDNAAQLLELAADALGQYTNLILLDLVFTQHVTDDGLAQPQLRVYFDSVPQQ